MQGSAARGAQQYACPLLADDCGLHPAEPQDDPRPAVHQAMPSMICPQTSVKVVGGRGTSVAHILAMALDDPSMDWDLRETLAAHEIVLEEEWADVE